MAGQPDPKPLADPVDRPFELGVLEGHDLARVGVDEVMVVLAGRVGDLVPRDPFAAVEAPHEPQLVQGLERPVDGGRRPGSRLSPEPVDELLGTEQAVPVASEQLDHRGAARARAQAGTAEPLIGVAEPPVAGHGIHPADGNENRSQAASMTSTVPWSSQWSACGWCRRPSTR